MAVLLSICSTLLPILSAQPGGGGEAYPDLRTNAAALSSWQDLRFGMFIHWGPISQRGTEIGWSRGREVPIEEYDQLYRTFNPTRFDADAWVEVAASAGMKYVIITSKHHDGFCLWDSKVTEYDIASTPFKRDVLSELAQACRSKGILFGTYHSICDWHHPDYTTRYGNDPRPVELSDMNRYRQYLFDQVRELVNDYGTEILWFDGEWEDSWTHADGMELYRFARGLKDDLLINNRVDKGRNGMQGMSLSNQFAGDFGTPEQRVGEFNETFPWESCITIGTQWAWKPEDTLKSPDECIRTLIRTVAGNGNLLLNVGPMPDGRIEPAQVDILKQLGAWLEQKGASIYGTRGGPYIANSTLAATRKSHTVFLHLLGDPGPRLTLPSLPSVGLKSARFLKGGAILATEEAGTITLPLTEPIDWSEIPVIELTFDGSVMDVQALEPGCPIDEPCIPDGPPLILEMP